MFWVFVILAALLYFGSRNSKKPFGCLGAIMTALVIVILGVIVCAIGFTGFFPF